MDINQIAKMDNAELEKKARIAIVNYYSEQFKERGFNQAKANELKEDYNLYCAELKARGIVITI